MIEAALVKLMQDGGSAAVHAGRVFPRAPQGVAAPFAIFERISAPRVHSHEGASGLSNPRIEVRSWARTYEEAKILADEIRKDLDGFSGVVTVRGVAWDVNSILLVDERDLFDDELKLFGVSTDYLVWHNEPTA